MERRTIFEQRWLPAALIAPQLALTVFFFLWPAGQAVLSSVQNEDPFGLSTQFVGLDNFVSLFEDELYLDTIRRTVVFCACTAVLSMGLALLLAVFADREIGGRGVYRTLLSGRMRWRRRLPPCCGFC